MLISLIIITIWLLLGLAATVREYYSTIKQFYIKFGIEGIENESFKEMMKLYKRFYGPLFILGGLFTFILHFIYSKENMCWYFKVPKN